jgi:hypothetical protein
MTIIADSLKFTDWNVNFLNQPAKGGAESERGPTLFPFDVTIGLEIDIL